MMVLERWNVERIIKMGKRNITTQYVYSRMENSITVT